MKILQINQTYLIGSTGKIMSDLNDLILSYGHESFMLCAYSVVQKDNLFIMDHGKFPFNSKVNILRTRITGLTGYVKKLKTQKALKWIETIKPDIIHLHNIHGDWINIELLFSYIKAHNIPIIWTLHDCWSFTGRCSHFELSNCEKWKRTCGNCPNKKVYPITYFLDFSQKMLLDKKRIYGDIDNLTLVTPSEWLAKYVKESFLGKNRVVTIHNGIDLKTYKKTSDANILASSDKKIILGVASSWSKTKGLYDFFKLNNIIDHDTYQIVLIGLNKKQMKEIPASIIGVERTTSQQELARYYSSAYVFINPTYQDNYPTTNLEAQACGTICYTYNTGGSPESVSPEYVFQKGDIEGIYRHIQSGKVCHYAGVEMDKTILFKKYIDLYCDVFERLT